MADQLKGKQPNYYEECPIIDALEIIGGNTTLIDNYRALEGQISLVV